MGGFLLTAQAADSTTTTTDTTTTTVDSNSTDVIGGNFGGMVGHHGFGGGSMRASGTYGAIEVSDEFKQTVTDIAENDTDVQTLLADGYNVTSITPIIKTVVDADGYVVTKATSAIVILQKDTTGYASVSVDIDDAKVAQIVILTRTVIDKS
jgi:hypothetical protein